MDMADAMESFEKTHSGVLVRRQALVGFRVFSDHFVPRGLKSRVSERDIPLHYLWQCHKPWVRLRTRGLFTRLGRVLPNGLSTRSPCPSGDGIPNPAYWGLGVSAAVAPSFSPAVS